MCVPVYSGVMTVSNMNNVETDFIYLGPVKAIINAHAILVNIGSISPMVVIQPRYILHRIINNDPYREISMKTAITSMKRVSSIPPQAQTVYEDALETLLLQYSEESRQLKACKKIQEAWHLSYNDPRYAICVRRLQREFVEICL